MINNRLSTVWCNVLLAVTAGLIANSALAVQPESWTHDQPSDFLDGTIEDLVVTSRGEVMLGREIKILLEADDKSNQAEVINDLARASDGRVYAATGPNGIIYRIDGDQVTEFAELADHGTILSLAFAPDGELLAGTGGGERARIYKIDREGKPQVFHELIDAVYVWDMQPGKQGKLFAATGPEGQIHVIEKNGTGKMLADFEQNNILCLTLGSDGMLYAGSDEDGLIYRVDPDTGKWYVMYDAEEAEISTIVTDIHGNIFAATAAAAAAKPGRSIADKRGGSPDRESDEGENDDADEDGEENATDNDAEDTKQEDGGNDKRENRNEQNSKDDSAEESDAESANGNNGADDSGDEGTDAENGDEPSNTDGADDTADEADSDDTAKAKAPIRLQVLPDKKALAKLRQLKNNRKVSTANGGSGNAIYRIDDEGFVTEVFREPVMILDLLETSGKLYAATGNEGRIYEIDPAGDRKIMLAKLTPKQAASLLRLPDGALIVGTANAATVVRIADRYAEKGTLVSEPLDADQIVRWGRVKWKANVPNGTRLSVATRSGNVSDAESPGWSDWSDELNATTPQQITSAGARLLQYRLTFETTVADKTPKLTEVSLSRMQENRAPEVTSVDVMSAQEAAGKPGTPPQIKQAANAGSYPDDDLPTPQIYWVADWDAKDPNEDELAYEVYFRKEGRSRWIELADDVEKSPQLWDTRTVEDGRYEIRVVASDAESNPVGWELSDARISDPVIIDNTPPIVSINEFRTLGDDGVYVRATFTDKLSTIEQAGYSVDSSEEWKRLAADDDIFDSPTETVTFQIDDLEPGEHVIALRVSDSQGNTQFVSREVNLSP